MSELLEIGLEHVTPHPDNPRVVLREDVIAAIVANLNGAFPQKHAIHVRRLGDGFQILSGHQRYEAAKRKGYATIWAWVDELDDAAAFMELVTSNNQGELDPAEIGVHVFQAVPTGQGKKGTGLQNYADRIGVSRPYVSQLRDAGDVLHSLRNLSYEVNLAAFLGKAKHLAAIHKLPRSLWQAMAEALLANEWSVEQTESQVAAGKAYLDAYDVPKEWREYLPKEVTALAVATGKTPASDFERLLAFAVEIEASLSAKVEALRDKSSVPTTVQDFAADWVTWLNDNTGGKSWNLRECRRQRDELDDAIAALSQTVGKSFSLFCCDFRTLSVEPGSVDWIITDPPYPKDFVGLIDGLGECAAKWLKPGGSLLCMIGESYLPEIYALLSKHLQYHWTLAYMTPGGQAVQIFPRKVNTFWKPVLWFVNGKYDGPWIGDVVTSDTNDNDKNHHHWGQSESGMADLMTRFVKSGDTVVEPFLGGGTTAVVAVRLGCRFVGCDVDKKSIEASQKRLEAIGD